MTTKPLRSQHNLCIFAFLSILSTLGCADDVPSAGPPTKYPYRIVTTAGMVTDIVAEVAGEHANVVGLMAATVDPHLFKPTRGDVLRLTEANVVFYSGLMLEGRMSDTFESLAQSGKPVFAVTAALKPEQLRQPPEFEGHPDPHVWMDVALWKECAREVAQRLAAYDPEHAQDYQHNATAYAKELDQLDAYVRQVIASVPEERRVLITAHDAFGYFGKAYGLEVESPQGITTESEPSVSDVNQLIDLIVSRKIEAIFVESSVNARGIRSIQQGAKERGWNLKLGGQLFSDAMGPEGTYEGTYIGMMDHNATTIARSLGGDAPERGMQGKLTP